MTHEAPKRYKPTKEALAATHAATDHDYERLAVAVVRAITLKQHNIIVRFRYFCKLPDTWPRGVLIKRDDHFNYFKVKTFKAAAWLHEHGYLAQGPKDIVKSQRSVVNLWGEVERMVDKNLAEEYNSCFVDEQIKEEE